MTAIPSNVVAYQPPAQSLGPLLPTSITEAMQLARVMSEARMVPEHLRGSPADCFLIVNQARLWRMDPFAVAQGTSFIHGKIMYEGKLTAAVVHSLGNLKSRLSYSYSGDGENRTVTVSGTLAGETEPRTVSVRLKDAKTNNKVWTTQPDQQLSYHGARVWARRHVPEVMLGIYAPEEFDAPPMRDVTPEAKQIERVPDKPPLAKTAPKPPLEVAVPGGWDPVQFERSKKGLREALVFMGDAIIEGGPQIVSMNDALLDTIAAKLPDLAEQVAELRKAADDALLADDAVDPVPEDGDGFVQRFVDPDGDDTSRIGDLPPKH
jgi:hypothetical protein